MPDGLNNSLSNQPSFAVVVPCYNDGDCLGRCLESVRKQTLAATQIIVVCDGSEDSTAEVCAKFAEQVGDLFVYHHQENAGVSAARNKGISLASADYLIFVDADDELAENAIENYASSLATSPNAMWLIANSQWERNDRIKSRSLTLPATRTDRFKQFLDKDLHLGNISNMCFARSAFDDIKFPPELRFGEDTVVFAVMLTKYDPSIVPQISALAHRRTDSLRSRATLDDLIASRVHEMVFAHPQLPEEYMRYRARHWARNCSSIMRRAFKDKQYEVAIDWYKQMIKSQPWYVFDARLAVKFLQALWRR